jgi:enoyl-CoA hydratase/carnithine racemase
MTFITMELSRRGSTGLLGHNRPDKLTAINATMIAEINLALDQVEADGRAASEPGDHA